MTTWSSLLYGVSRVQENQEAVWFLPSFSYLLAFPCNYSKQSWRGGPLVVPGLRLCTAYAGGRVKALMGGRNPRLEPRVCLPRVKLRCTAAKSREPNKNPKQSWQSWGWGGAWPSVPAGLPVSNLCAPRQGQAVPRLLRPQMACKHTSKPLLLSSGLRTHSISLTQSLLETWDAGLPWTGRSRICILTRSTCDSRAHWDLRQSAWGHGLHGEQIGLVRHVVTPFKPG